MSESMIERVARACWQTQTIRAWEDAHETEREEMIGYARAAIEALRLPTSEMCERGGEAHQRYGYTQETPRAGIAGLIFRAMLDAALNEDAPR